MDIEKLLEIAQHNLAQVEKHGISKAYLDEAALFIHELADVLAIKQGKQSNSVSAKIERDRAACLAGDYASLVREYADVIYNRDPEKRALFTCIYSRQRNGTTKKPDPEPPIKSSL